MSYKIKVKKVHPDAQLPFYAEPDAVGADLYCVETFSLKRGERKLVDTGIIFEPEIFCDIQIRPRSGLALKYGISVLNSPGSIDPSFRNNIMVLLINHGDCSFFAEKGDRIAQVVCNPLRPEFIEVDEVNETERNLGGFGSTGLK